MLFWSRHSHTQIYKNPGAIFTINIRTLCSVLFYSTMFCSGVVYCTVLWYTVLYCNVLCCTVLYSTLICLLCSVLVYAVPGCWNSVWTLGNCEWRGAGQGLTPLRWSPARTDGGLTMQMSCLKDTPNIWAGTKGDTPEVVDRDSVLYVFMYRRRQSHGVMYSVQQNRIQGGRGAASWGSRS